MSRSYGSFRQFYPDYLAEHRNPVSRRLHFVGTALLLALLVVSLVSRQFHLLLAAPVVGYGLAWVGHFLFEKNRPTTFRHPLYSLAGDLTMFRDILTGRIPL